MKCQCRSFILASLVLAGSASAQTTSTLTRDERNAEAATTKAEAEAQTALANARKAESDADKAEADNATAIAKGKFGEIAGYQTPGTQTAGDKAGQIEAALLAGEATETASKRIIDQICVALTDCAAASTTIVQPSAVVPTRFTDIANVCASAMGSPVPSGGAALKALYIFTETSPPTFDHADAVRATLCGIHRKLVSAMDRHQRVNGVVPAIAPVLLGTILSVGGNLLRSDYTVQGIAVSSDDLLLAKSVAAVAAPRLGRTVYLPNLYRRPAMVASNPIVVAVTALNKLRDDATVAAGEHQKRVDEAAVAAKKKPQQAEAIVKMAKPHADVAAELLAAAKAYDDYLAKIVTPSDNGLTELGESAREALVQADLAAGALMLILKMNSAGGTSYTKKNFFTFFGGAPFYVSGGTVASFTLLEGVNGSVRATGLVTTTTGFESVGAFHRRRAKK